jgi:hypothetical protein
MDKFLKVGGFFKNVGERIRIMKPSTEVERTMIGIELAREVVNDL